jgi:hypothetical protein
MYGVEGADVEQLLGEISAGRAHGVDAGYSWAKVQDLAAGMMTASGLTDPGKAGPLAGIATRATQNLQHEQYEKVFAAVQTMAEKAVKYEIEVDLSGVESFEEVIARYNEALKREMNARSNADLAGVGLGG